MQAVVCVLFQCLKDPASIIDLINFKMYFI